MTQALTVAHCAAQMGYNLLYGLWKYAWDADCELFLKILEGETKEDVYVQQVQLQVLDLNVEFPKDVTGLPPASEMTGLHKFSALARHHSSFGSCRACLACFRAGSRAASSHARGLLTLLARF